MKKLTVLVSLFFISALGFSQTIPSYIPLSNLVAWYPFNGNANDETGNGNGSNFIKATLSSDRFNNINKAYSFNGFNNQYISCNNVSLPMGKSKRTISMWLYPTGVVNNGWTLTAFSYGQPVTSKANMVGLYNGTVRYMGWGDELDAYYPYSLNQWINVITTFDSINVKIYVNGNLIGSTTKSAWNTTGSQYYFGTRADTLNSFWNGKIDDIAVWGRVLSASEILQVYRSCNLTITAHPGNINSSYGNSAQFIVASSDPNANYKWLTDLGSGFQNVNNTSQYKGFNNDTLTVSGLNMLNHNQKFKCVIFSGTCYDTTNFAVLTVSNMPPKIIPKYIAANNLIAWYPFNGNAIDETGNGNNATNIKANLTSDRQSNLNKSYSFNGFNNEFISCVNSNLPMGKSKRTISMWLNPSGIVNSSQTLTAFSYGVQNSGNANMVGLYNGTVRYMSWLDELDVTYPYLYNQWINVTTTFDSLNAKIFVNGNFIGSAAKSAWNTIGWQYYFGTRADTSNSFFNGKIDDIAIWGRELSSSEIMKLYTGCDLSVTLQPKNDTVVIGNSARFIIETSELTATLQWQTDVGSGFQNIINGGQYSGSDNDTLTISGFSLVNNNQLFRCVISKGVCTDTSVVVLLKVKNNFIIPGNIPTANLVAWYPFNGNASDESGNANDPVTVKATITSDRNSTINKAYQFDGFNKQYIACQNKTLPPGNSSRTISIWLYPTAVVDSTQTLTAFSYGTQLTSKANMLGLFNNKIRYMGWLDELDVAYNYSFNQWLHIIATFDGTTSKIYANGNLIGTGNNSNWNTFASQLLYIGTRQDTLNSFFNGKIDDIAVWGRVLSNAEIIMVFGGPVGLEKEFAKNNFSVYPNPSQSSLTLYGNLSSNSNRYAIFDQTGRLIKFGELEKTNIINIEDIEKGLYFLILNDQNISKTKFIKN